TRGYRWFVPHHDKTRAYNGSCKHSKWHYTLGSHPGSYSLLHNCKASLSFRMRPFFGSVCNVRPVRWAILPNCTSKVLWCPPIISERRGAPLRIASKKLRI